jgi:hypothetical protein
MSLERDLSAVPFLYVLAVRYCSWFSWRLGGSIIVLLFSAVRICLIGVPFDKLRTGIGG